MATGNTPLSQHPIHTAWAAACLLGSACGITVDEVRPVPATDDASETLNGSSSIERPSVAPPGGTLYFDAGTTDDSTAPSSEASPEPTLPEAIDDTTEGESEGRATSDAMSDDAPLSDEPTLSRADAGPTDAGGTEPESGDPELQPDPVEPEPIEPDPPPPDPPPPDEPQPDAGASTEPVDLEGLDAGASTASPLPEPSVCPTALRGGRCLVLIQQPRDWDTARTACQGAGGDLVSVRNVAQDLTLGALLAEQVSFDSIWIGVREGATELLFEHTDGTPIAFDNFAEGQPNDTNAPRCVEKRDDFDGQWFDRPCSRELPFVCELPFD